MQLNLETVQLLQADHNFFHAYYDLVVTYFRNHGISILENAKKKIKAHSGDPLYWAFVKVYDDCGIFLKRGSSVGSLVFKLFRFSRIGNSMTERICFFLYQNLFCCVTQVQVSVELQPFEGLCDLILLLNDADSFGTHQPQGCKDSRR